MEIIGRIAEFHGELTEWRHDIHAHPELGFEEQRTSDFVAQKLAEFGCEVFRGIGQTGVVGRLRAGASGRSIGLRADMDCLPIAELNHFSHRSRHEGRMHACGHDGHATMLLGAARHLAARGRFRRRGPFHLPARRGDRPSAAAQSSIADGLFERFPCDAVSACTICRGSRPASSRPAGPTMGGGVDLRHRVPGAAAMARVPKSGIDDRLCSQIAIAAYHRVAQHSAARDGGLERRPDPGGRNA